MKVHYTLFWYIQAATQHVCSYGLSLAAWRQLCLHPARTWVDKKSLFHYSHDFLILLLNAGGIDFKALDSSPNWAALDQGVKDILLLLLHDQPEYRLTAAQLLHNPWLYEAQGKSFPVKPISTPPVTEVPEDITQRIQGRGRQCLTVFKDTCGAHMQAHAKQPQHCMASHRGELRLVQQAEAVQCGLAPYAAAPSTSTFRLDIQGISFATQRTSCISRYCNV